MPNKITMINLVWMTVMTGMLTATVALYDKKIDDTKVFGPYASAKSVGLRQY